MKKVFLFQNGFTFPEVVVVIGVISMIFGLAISGTLKSQQGTSLQSTVALLISDIKHQQVNSMTGFTLGGESASSYGVYFEGSRYTLFKGNVYDPNDIHNFAVMIPENIQIFDVSFPNSILVFMKGSGEVFGFTPGSNTVSLKTTLSTSKTVTVNKFGTVTGAN